LGSESIVLLGRLGESSHAEIVGGCEWSLSAQQPRVASELIEVVARLIYAIDAHDRAAAPPQQERGRPPCWKAILVFLPGFGEIQSLVGALEGSCGPGRPFVPVALHSQLARSEQQQAFGQFPGQRKIIVSTNIAESSLTVRIQSASSKLNQPAVFLRRN